MSRYNYIGDVGLDLGYCKETYKYSLLLFIIIQLFYMFFNKYIVYDTAKFFNPRFEPHPISRYLLPFTTTNTATREIPHMHNIHSRWFRVKGNPFSGYIHFNVQCNM